MKTRGIRKGRMMTSNASEIPRMSSSSDLATKSRDLEANNRQYYDLALYAVASIYVSTPEWRIKMKTAA
jgi:hypothetical protein